MAISELKLAKELIRRPSITPKDAGAINVLAKSLRSLGFKCQIINFKNVKNLYAKLGRSSPNFCYAGHTDVVPPGNINSWTVNPFKPTVKNKKLILGTWQGIYLFEHRLENQNRKISYHLMGD